MNSRKTTLPVSRIVYSLIRKFINWCTRKLFSIIHTDKVILFESHPDFTCNTYPVYLKLRKMLPDYKMVWMLHGTDTKDADDTLIFAPKSLKTKLKKYYYLAKAKAIISCNGYVPKLKAEQLSLYLDHGAPLKNVTGMYNLADPSVDFHNVLSPFFDDILLKETGGTPDKFVHLGFPRCDYFFSESRQQDIDQIVKGKYIVWLPTFRGHFEKIRDDAPGSPFNNIGVPVFYSLESLKSFDGFLRDNGITILYKPHPAQDLDVVKEAHFSNFRIIYDADILTRNLQLYEVIAQSEALITDYSSIFWEYMLLDRPIAITNDDIEEYRAGLSFIMDIESVYSQTAEVVPDEESMRAFVLNVVAGRDIMREGRREWRDKLAMYSDGKSAQRAAEFVIEKISRS